MFTFELIMLFFEVAGHFRCIHIISRDLADDMQLVYG